MEKTILVDIDGTLADITHRLHHIKDGKKDWPAFNAAMHLDKPKKDIIELVSIIPEHWSIILVSGRFDTYRETTETWLHENKVPFDKLLMRKEGDYRSDYLVKEEIYENELKGKFNIVAVIDDRQAVVDMWRSKGLTVLQCQKGDY